jgi:hypothetical protein
MPGRTSVEEAGHSPWLSACSAPSAVPRPSHIIQFEQQPSFKTWGINPQFKRWGIWVLATLRKLVPRAHGHLWQNWDLSWFCPAPTFMDSDTCWEGSCCTLWATHPPWHSDHPFLTRLWLK